jgi:serine acetyltransferase
VKILQDWQANAGDKKAQIVMLAFRTAQMVNASQSLFARVVAKPYTVAYRIIIDWVLGVEIPWQTQIGPELRLQHAQSIVINAEVVIGSRVSLHQGVTLGGRRSGHDCPIIGDAVRVGAGAIIIGDVRVGNEAIVGAGAVVVHDVAPKARVVGNPARVVS